MTTRNTMTASEFDQRFDDGEDMADAVDWSKADHVNRESEPVGLTLPAWMVDALQDEAGRLGVTTESLIKFWISERLRKQ